MEYQNQFQPAAVTDTQTLPSWVRGLFRFYAVYTLFLVIVTGASLVYSLIIKNQNLIGDLWGDAPTLDSIVITSLAIHGALLLLLLIFFIIGILQYRRWVLPLVLIFSLHTIVVTVLYFFTQQLSGLVTLGFSLLNLGLALVLTYAAVQYWSSFAGPVRRLLIQIPLLFFLLPHLVLPALFAIFPDDKTINDQDLLLEPVAVLAPEDNAYFALPDISNAPEYTQEIVSNARRIMREEQNIDATDPTILSLVDETTELTDAFLLAAGRTGYQCPTSINNYSLEAELCSLGDIQTLAILTSLRAQVEAETLSIDEALLTAASIMQFGTHFTHTEQPQVIEYLVGMAVQGIGMDAIEQILLSDNTPSNTTLARIITVLEQAEASETTVINALRYEYMVLRQSGEALASYSNYFFQHKKTTNMYAQNIRYNIAAVSKGCNANTSVEETAIEAMINDAVSVRYTYNAVQPNYIGRVLFAVSATSLTNVGDSICEINERNQQLQTQLQSKLSLDID